MEAKRILAVHDLSCHGSASLGIAIPVLTAFGHKVVALPSVLLSSSTDIDSDPVALSTTEWMQKIVARWKEQNLKFDAIYTGWLGDPRQISLLLDLCDTLRYDATTIFVDPVLGDGGVLYPCQRELVEGMKKLAVKAHVITPNPTEAALLLGKEPKDFGVREDGTITVARARGLVGDLVAAYPNTLPIVKSVVSRNRIGVCAQFTLQDTPNMRRPATRVILEPRTSLRSVGGTGDLFASLLVGRWLQRGLGDQSGYEDKVGVISSVVKTVSAVMKDANNRGMVDLPFRSLFNIK